MNHLIWKPNHSNQPIPIISPDGNSLTLISKPKSNFWITTRTCQLDGDFGYQKVKGDFQFSIRLKGEYDILYDHAGLMVYLNEHHWVKAGVELVDDLPYVSAVVTDPLSDWSVVPVKTTSKQAFHTELVDLRLERKDRHLIIDYHLNDNLDPNPTWLKLREVNGFFPPDTSQVQVGIMAASPQSSTGFKVEFQSYQLKQ